MLLHINYGVNTINDTVVKRTVPFEKCDISEWYGMALK